MPTSSKWAGLACGLTVTERGTSLDPMTGHVKWLPRPSGRRHIAWLTSQLLLDGSDILKATFIVARRYRRMMDGVELTRLRALAG